MSAIAIVNCRLRARCETISSGVVLIEQGVIVACGPDHEIILPVTARLLDADRGEILPGRRDEAGKMIADAGFLRPGMPATLFCRSRFDETTWAMEAGVMIPRPGDALPVCPFWQHEREKTINALIRFLTRRAETLSVQRAAGERAQKQGVDLFWRFEKAGSAPEIVSIGVYPTFNSSSDSFFWIQRQAGHPLANQTLHDVKAQWIFCLDRAQRRLYCLPTHAFRRWLSEQADDLPETIFWPTGARRPFIGRTLSPAQMRTAIPRTKIVKFES